MARAQWGWDRTGAPCRRRLGRGKGRGCRGQRDLSGGSDVAWAEVTGRVPGKCHPVPASALLLGESRWEGSLHPPPGHQDHWKPRGPAQKSACPRHTSADPHPITVRMSGQDGACCEISCSSAHPVFSASSYWGPQSWGSTGHRRRDFWPPRPPPASRAGHRGGPGHGGSPPAVLWLPRPPGPGRLPPPRGAGLPQK